MQLCNKQAQLLQIEANAKKWTVSKALNHLSYGIPMLEEYSVRPVTAFSYLRKLIFFRKLLPFLAKNQP